MKKIFKTVLAVILCITSIMPMNSFAVDGEKVQWQDIDLPEAEIQRILDLNPQGEVSTRASDLIISYNVAIDKDGTTLKLAAKIFCDVDVVKCGFKKIVIQRRATTSSAWSDYITYKEVYNDYSSHLIARTMTVQTGYQYRAVCTFYAKKSLLSTQKIEHSSNIKTF